jgi:hypothetical protein
VEIKCQLEATDFFIADMEIKCQLGQLRFSPQTGYTTFSYTPYRQLENQAPKTTGGKQLYNTLELLMMGIMVPRNMLSKQ